MPGHARCSFISAGFYSGSTTAAASAVSASPAETALGVISSKLEPSS
jgi:hypothetical protein